MKPKIYPANKAHFKKLIPFTKKILSVCKEAGINPVIYGSFAHFYHTRDEKMKVNDIDILIPKRDFPRLVKGLEKNKIKFKYYPAPGLIIKKGKLKVEVDEVGTGYKTLTEKSLSKNIFDKADFYEVKVRLITLKQLEEIYLIAYNRSREDKVKILKKIKHLERFLGRKLK